MAAAALLQAAAPCDALKALSLPHVTITGVEFVAAGAAAPGRGGRGEPAAPLPAYCRVAATLTPSPDSHIEMELWMPAENWNGKFLAVGNGGWAGNVRPTRWPPASAADTPPPRTTPGIREEARLSRSASREADRFRLPRDARDGGAVEGDHPGLLQPRPQLSYYQGCRPAAGRG